MNGVSKRDLGLAAGSLLLLALQHRLPGHLPAGMWLGALLVLAATVGILGLLGDSPLDLRGDEVEATERAPWHQRGGVRVVLFGVLLLVPFAGGRHFGLWDPWETHYSEVAREILSRDDWITLWWAQEGWFMSKPILIFWMSALGMGFGSVFGARFTADAGPNVSEWFIRLPIIALAIGAMWAVYRAVASAWGQRAGVLAAVVLATMPQFFFLAHQAMTDMPFVAPLTIALCMFMLAATSDPEALAVARKVRLGRLTLRVSMWHLVVGAVLMLALPQVVYLVTRPLVLACPADAAADQCGRMMRMNRVGPVQLPFETFYLGSAGNSALRGEPAYPGSPAWERVASAVAFFPSVLQGALWAALLAWLLSRLRALRGVQGLYYVAFYTWCAVATMGKGPAGIAIPGAVALLHFLSPSRRAGLLRVRVGEGLATFAVVGLPWYVAVTGRLGDEFIQRFIVHDIINRTMAGVHGDTGSVRYFLLQLGYAMFPWSALVPMALFGWRQIVPRGATAAQRDVARIGMYWFLVSFVLFSAMVTKFHHYIFPSLPGAAVMVGLLLDRMLPRAGDRRFSVAALGAQAASVLLVTLGAARCLGGWSGNVPASGPVAPSPVLGAVLIALGAVAWVAGYQLAGGADDAPEDAVARAETTGFGAWAVAAVALVGFVTRDMVSRQSTPPGSERLIHLFVYNYDRPWPRAFLDYAPMLLGFGVAAALVIALFAVRPMRAWAAQGAVVLASLWAVWALDVYMIGVTPHWSQRPLFDRYYALRAQRPGPIIAHQMNWKGENFYTGNHVIAMECGLKYCTGTTGEWVRDHPHTHAYFITEHSRLQGLLSTIRNYGGDGRAVTSERDDNKFLLVEADLGQGGPRPARPAAPSHDDK